MVGCGGVNICESCSGDVVIVVVVVVVVVVVLMLLMLLMMMMMMMMILKAMGCNDGEREFDGAVVCDSDVNGCNAGDYGDGFGGGGGDEA